jgi:hypothetical protein
MDLTSVLSSKVIPEGSRRLVPRKALYAASPRPPFSQLAGAMRLEGMKRTSMTSAGVLSQSSPTTRTAIAG